MRIVIINGPNLNLLGVREKHIYGETPFELFFHNLSSQFPAHQLEYFQSNHEGAIIDKLHEVGFGSQGIILNAGAYSHTSLGMADAIAAIEAPVIEVHISNVYQREAFRQTSMIARNCAGVITGLGLEGYSLALVHFLSRVS